MARAGSDGIVLSLTAPRWWAVALRGVAALVLAGFLVAHPLAGAVALAWWLGVYALASGVLLLVLAAGLWRAQRGEAWA
jgi:uncharacterized membrane protein HdeD (DUF308 family)